MSKQESVDAFLDQDTNLVKAAVDLKTEKFGWTEVEHGLTADGDYVWHFSNHHRHRTFPQDLYKIKQIIVTYLSKLIPDTIQVICLDPPSDWDKKVITVKAKGFGKTFNFDALMSTLHDKNLKIIGDMISTEIEIANPRRA